MLTRLLAAFVGLGLAGGTVYAIIIGQDAFGYTVKNEPFAFEDITRTGFRNSSLGQGGSRNLQAGELFIPNDFSFMFYGTVYGPAPSKITIHTDGFIGFGAPGSVANVDFTTTWLQSLEHPVINVLGDDWKFFLDAGLAGDALYHEVRGTPGDYRLIVQWNEAYNLNPNDTVTFQAILFQNSSDIVVNYLDSDSGDGHALGQLASVGMRDIKGHINGRAIQYSFHTPNISGGSSIRFSALVPIPAGLPLFLTSLAVLGIVWWRKRAA